MRYDPEKLKEARLRKGWDQTTLAFHAGLSVATICKIERGNRVGSLKTVKKITDALGIAMKRVLMEESADSSTPEPEPVGDRA